MHKHLHLIFFCKFKRRSHTHRYTYFSICCCSVFFHFDISIFSSQKVVRSLLRTFISNIPILQCNHRMFWKWNFYIISGASAISKNNGKFHKFWILKHWTIYANDSIFFCLKFLFALMKKKTNRFCNKIVLVCVCVYLIVFLYLDLAPILSSTLFRFDLERLSQFSQNLDAFNINK